MPVPVSDTIRRTNSPSAPPLRAASSGLSRPTEVCTSSRPPRELGVARVDAEVEQDLLEPGALHPHPLRPGAAQETKLDLAPDEAAQQLLPITHGLVEIEDLGTEHLLAAEGEKLPPQVRHPVHGPLHLVEILTCLRADARVASGVVHEPAERVQLIVEVVCQSARKPADRLHLGRLAEPPFDAAMAARACTSAEMSRK
jgi:hypothetical protein